MASQSGFSKCDLANAAPDCGRATFLVPQTTENPSPPPPPPLLEVEPEVDAVVAPEAEVEIVETEEVAAVEEAPPSDVAQSTF